jgi:hypothetical protein
LALAFGAAYGAAGGLPESSAKISENESRWESEGPPPKSKKESRKETLETLKSLLERFKDLRWKYREASQRKTEQEQTLENMKMRPGGGRFMSQYFRRQEIFRLQEQLHLTIEEREACALETLKTAEEIARRAPAFQKAMADLLKAGRRGPEAGEDAPAAAARQKKRDEIDSHLSLLDRILDNPSQAEQILIRAFDEEDSTRPPGNQGHPFIGMRHRGQGGAGPLRHGSLDSKIRALEYEQESLYRQWQRNETTLRALQRMQDKRQDESDPEQPPFPPRGNRRGQEGSGRGIPPHDWNQPDGEESGNVNGDSPAVPGD